ncbi:MAG: carboxypeptidase-like regulatory domain-containing protein, partial [Bacteroidota bacterium]
MKLKACSLLLILYLSCGSLMSQLSISGLVEDSLGQNPLPEVEVYLSKLDKKIKTDQEGKFLFKNLNPGTYELLFFSPSYELKKELVQLREEDISLNIVLSEITYEMSEVVIAQSREELFALKRLKEVEGTAIYAGKKTE